MAGRKIQAVLAQMQKNLECSICLEMMKNPVSTACGHQFCKFCITEFLERKKQVPCPLCKKAVTKRGMKERQQLGEIVSNVHKLIEAYQADTGSLFSPPRGCSMNMLPSTPDSIKTKQTKPATRRNVRGSNSVSMMGRTARESRRLNMNVKQNNQQPQGMAAQDHDLTERIDGSLEEIGFGNDTKTVNNEDDKVKNTRNRSVQHLLDLIETGSHGAIEESSQSELELNIPKNSKSLQNQSTVPDTNSLDSGMEDADICVDQIQPEADVEVENKCSDRIEGNVGEVNTAYCDNNYVKGKQDNHYQLEEFIQSGRSVPSQSSSEDVVSLFRTPLDIKAKNQKLSKGNIPTKKNTRSLRSGNASDAIPEHVDHIESNTVENLTPDCNFVSDIFDTKPEIVKTYGRKNSLERDVKSKRKVSDWLKGLPNDKSEPAVLSKDLSDVTNKASHKPVSTKQTINDHKQDVIGGDGRDMQAGSVSDSLDGSLFGFEVLDKTGDKPTLSSDKGNQDNTNHQKVENSANSDKFQNDINTTILNRPVQRKRIFKSKQNKSRNSDAEETQLFTNVDSSTEEGNQEKTNTKEKDTAGSVKTNDIEKAAAKIPEKAERLLKMSDSPMNGSSGGLDPYEFRSSQKTPQKMKYNAASKPKKSQAKNAKRKVVNVTKTQKTKDMSKSKLAIKLDGGKPKIANKNKMDVENRSKGEVTCSQLNAMSAIIDEAENHDLLTCTQEVLKNMPEHETQGSKHAKHQDESKTSKKQVRFREPALADLISPGKIDIAAYRKEKKVFQNTAENNVRIQKKGNHIVLLDSKQSLLSNKGDKPDLHQQRNEKKTLPDVKTRKSGVCKQPANGRHCMEDNEMQDSSSKEEENDSDDVSEDYRFHDNSSGTDDLDINPDVGEFEQPDLEKQPEEVELRLTGTVVDNDSISSTECRSPDVNSVKDTPQVQKGPRFNSSFSKPVKVPRYVSKVVNIVEETPLYVDQDSELETEQNEGSAVNADMSENPVIASNVNDVNDEDANTACDNDDQRSLADNLTGVESEPLNLNIETLAETDDVISNSMGAKELDREHGNTTHDDSITDKASDNETKIRTDTDETQTPSGDFNLALVDKTVIDANGKETEDFPEVSTCENVQETMDSLADSQRSMSVLEVGHGKCKRESSINQYNNNAIFETDEKLIITEIDYPKVKKKKRKCFMLEDTQGDEEFCSSLNSSSESLLKRQKIMSPNSQKPTKGMNSDKKSGQFSSGVGITKTDVTITELSEKQELDKINEREEEIVLISQGSSEIQSSLQKERHLSGILMSPDENQNMSPENIFYIDSEMPTVNLSPEEETQFGNSGKGTNGDLINDSLTQKTHVSDTQTSQEKLTTPKRTQSLVTQEEILTQIGNKRNQPSVTDEKILTPSGSKRRSGVKASRGFSKRTRLSDDGIVVVGTSRTPKASTNSSTFHASLRSGAVSVNSGHESPKERRHSDDGEHTIRAQGSPLTPHSPRLPTRTKQSNEAETHEVIITSPSVNKVLNTPRRQNLLKYKSPVAGIKPLRSHNTPSVTNTPSTPWSSSTLKKISKYSPGIHKTRVPHHSPISKEKPMNNAVEVVEIDRSVTKDESESCSPNKNSIKKKSPVLQLQLGSQERSKLVEHVPIGQIAESEADIIDERMEETPLPCLEHVDESETYENKSLQSTEPNNWNDEKGETDDPYMEGDVNTDGVENHINIKRNTKLNNLRPLIGDPDEDSSSSDDLCLDDSSQMDIHKDETRRRNDARQANITPSMSHQTVCDKYKNDKYKTHTVGKLNEFSHDLCLDDSSDSEIDKDDDDCDSSDSEIDKDDNDCDGGVQRVNVDHQELQSSDCDSDIVEDEALVIEESDLEDEPKRPDADMDDIRKVKRLRPKRAILSDSDSDSGDESTHLDCTSSSAFSSQSENLTTQDREKLEEDLEKMEAEMAVLRNQLNKKGAVKKSISNKGPVMVLDDDDDHHVADDENIEGDDSDIENLHETCMSPPPFSPVILSQEQSNHHASQESTQEPVNVKKDCMNNNDRKTGTELSPVRQPLKDIDVNIVSKIPDKDQIKDLPVENKRLGFVATGLSSLQVIEIKKLAAANDVVFYSKMNPSVSHVIVKADEDDNRMCDRTLKFFQGIAHKCWLVIYQWVIDSKEAGYLIPESHYEIQGDTTLGILHNGPQKSRLSKDDLFKGIQFSFFGDNRYLNKDSLAELIESCGGEIVSNLSHNRPGTLAICCTDLEEEGSQENSEAVSKSKELKKEYGVVTLKRDWVMDSLTTYKVQPFKPYTIL